MYAHTHLQIMHLHVEYNYIQQCEDTVVVKLHSFLSYRSTNLSVNLICSANQVCALQGRSCDITLTC